MIVNPGSRMYYQYSRLHCSSHITLTPTSFLLCSQLFCLCLSYLPPESYINSVSFSLQPLSPIQIHFGEQTPSRRKAPLCECRGRMGQDRVGQGKADHSTLTRRTFFSVYPLSLPKSISFTCWREQPHSSASYHKIQRPVFPPIFPVNCIN